jgi:hypothetical protein
LRPSSWNTLCQRSPSMEIATLKTRGHSFILVP